MPSFYATADQREWVNNTAGTVVSGDLVVHTDDMVGIVSGLGNVPVGGRRMITTAGRVKIDKLSGTVIAAGDKITYDPATKQATVGAPAGAQFYAGVAAEAAGSGTLSVIVTLNSLGPTV